jgi:uncharacterized protein
MGEHPNVAAARTAITALMRGEVETLAGGIAEDAVWHVPGAHKLSGDLTGRERILGRGQEMAEAGARLVVEELHDIVGNDEHVVALVKTTTTGPGGSSTQNSVWVMHVRDGQATELWVHNWDQAAIDAVMGG